MRVQKSLEKKFLNLKSEKGSITIFVLSVMLLLISVVSVTYIGMANKTNSQNAEIRKIVKEYEKQVADIDKVYKDAYNLTLVDVDVTTLYYIAEGGTLKLSASEIASITPNENAERAGISIDKIEYVWNDSLKKENQPETWNNSGKTLDNGKWVVNDKDCLWTKITLSDGDSIVLKYKMTVVKEVIEYSVTKNDDGTRKVDIEYKNAFTEARIVTVVSDEDYVVNEDKSIINLNGNGNINVSAKDKYQNEFFLSIDLMPPTVTLTDDGGYYRVSKDDETSIKVKIDADDGEGSGISEIKYAWSQSNENQGKPTEENYTYVSNGETIEKRPEGMGTYYLWVKVEDKKGNVAEIVSNAYLPAIPNIELQENNENGAKYVSGTWTNQDVYATVSVPTVNSSVVGYQYTTDNVLVDENGKEIDFYMNYTTAFSDIGSGVVKFENDDKPLSMGELTNTEGTEYHMIASENTLVPNNVGVHNSQADSYIPIDVTSFPADKTISVTVNAGVSSEGSYDYGYACLTETPAKPTFNKNSTMPGEFFKKAGTVANADYKTSVTGGKIYYLHLGYYKDGSANSGNDKVTVNSISIVSDVVKTTWDDIPGEIVSSYTSTFTNSTENKPEFTNSEKEEWLGNIELTPGASYGMNVEGSALVSGNTGVHSSQSDVYIPIDLTGFSSELIMNLTINANVSSENNCDYGYACLTENVTIPTFNKNSTMSGEFFKKAGAVANADYKISVTGGKIYYLHLGYYKDGSKNVGNDKFTVNSINIDYEHIVNYYNYNKNENTITFKLKEEMNKTFAIKAIYEDGKESYISDFSVKIDKTAPIVNTITSELVSQTESKIMVSGIEEQGSGIKGYYISEEQVAPTTTNDWTSFTGNSFEVNGLKPATQYYVWIIDNANNISKCNPFETENINYKIDDSKYASKLVEALNMANENSTIELLRDFTDSSTATINKNVTIDTGTYTLTRTGNTTLSGATLTFNGIITSNLYSTISVSGISTLKGTGTIKNTGTTSSYRSIYINSGAQLIQEGEIIVSGYYGIDNSGTYNLNSGKVEATYTSGGYAVYNRSSSSVINILSGNIEGYNGLYNNYGITNIYGGNIKGTVNSGICMSNGTSNIEGGNIEGKTNGIYLSGSGTTNILGGTVKGSNGIQLYSSNATANILGGNIIGSTYGIYGYTTSNGKLTIGNYDEEVDTTNPIVSGGQYGIYMKTTTNTYNFNNGIIMGTNTVPYTDTAIPREGYRIVTYYDYNGRRYVAVLDKEENNITIEHNPNDRWTNEGVELHVRYPSSGTIYEYSEDGENWENIENVFYITNRYENKKIYARMLDSSGVLIESVEYTISNIDRILPEVTISPETTKYIIYNKGEQSVDIELSLSITEEGGSGLKIAQYGWSEDKDITPSTWNTIVNDAIIKKENCTQGKYYLWINVMDNAGNKCEIDKIMYIVEEEQAVARVSNGDGTYKFYYTLQEAIDEAEIEETTIEMIRSTNEIAIIEEGQTIILDLNGCTIGSSISEQATITNNGTLKITDSIEEKCGLIENYVGTAIENNGTLILGEDSDEIEDETPKISGKKIGIRNNGTMDFYDGTIMGKTALIGDVRHTPEDYGAVGVLLNETTVVNLRIISDYVARIEWTYYDTLQGAFDACISKNNNREQTTVHLLKDIVMEQGVAIYYGQNIKLNLNSHTVTSTENRVVVNYGNLEITDLTEEQTGEIYSITSTESNSNTIYNNNKGNIKITGGTITATNNKKTRNS